MTTRVVLAIVALNLLANFARAGDVQPSAAEVLDGLREFYRKTARPDGSFTPGVDPEYRGMSDSAYSDLAAITYACTLHKTFGWKLPYEKQTIELLLSRQRKSGEFFNVAGTVDAESAEGKTYNTTQGLVALRSLGVKPRYYPLAVFEEILKQDYKILPAYSTSFFPLAYLCFGQPIPAKADRAIRELMLQDGTGYLNNHIAATFHASHYYRLIGETPPLSHEMVARILREQKQDGSWLLNMPSRDRHATFDAVFTLRHEGGDRLECRAAIARAKKWALSCRSPDGGFGHFPGSTSDADAVYFQVGVLVMAGFLHPAEPLPPDARLLSWGHLMPLAAAGSDLLRIHHKGWVGGVALSPDGQKLATASSDTARLFNLKGKEALRFSGHSDLVGAIAFSPDGRTLATGSYDQTARIWDADSGTTKHVLSGHRGPVMAVAFSPNGQTLATASVDAAIRLWNAGNGELLATLSGHKSWVNSVVFSTDGRQLVSGSSDGTIKLWSLETRQELKAFTATNAEVRSVAIAPDGNAIAAGIRYGLVKIMDVPSGQERFSIAAHQGDAWCVAFSGDGKTVISGGGDWNRPGFVKFWSVADGRQTGQLQHTGEVLSLALAPRGEWIAAGGGDSMAIVFPAKAAR